MSRNLKTSLHAIVLALGMASCVYPVGLKIAGEPGVPVFSTTQAKPCVRDLSVLSMDRSRRVLWRIRAAAQCVELRRIGYGTLPAGFVTVVDAAPLDLQSTYVVTVSTSAGGGLGAFALEAGKYRLVDTDPDWPPVSVNPDGPAVTTRSPEGYSVPEPTSL